MQREVRECNAGLTARGRLARVFRMRTGEEARAANHRP